MLKITNNVTIPTHEIEFTQVRAAGPGGQHVNKVSSAIHLRFDIHASSLPQWYKNKLLQYKDYRISKDGIIIIKAQRFRSQIQNKEDALDRLYQLIKKATKVEKIRKATKPSKSAKKKRLESKSKRGKLKYLRSKRSLDD
jgi:ribosome-associated protein